MLFVYFADVHDNLNLYVDILIHSMYLHCGEKWCIVGASGRQGRLSVKPLHICYWENLLIHLMIRIG